MEFDPKSVISLSFWRHLQAVKTKLAENPELVHAFDKDPSAVIKETNVDIEIKVEGSETTVRLSELLDAVSPAQRSTILQYIRPRPQPVQGGAEGAALMAAGAGLLDDTKKPPQNPSAAVNLVSVANGGVSANAVANANLMLNANAISNVNLVLAVPISADNEV